MKDKKTPNDKIQLTLPLNRRVLKYVIVILLLTATVYTIVVAPQKISAAVSFVLSLLSPFIIGFCLAYVVNLLLRPIERFWLFIWKKLKNKKVILKLKRPICLFLSFVIVLGAIFAIVFMIIPSFEGAALSFVDEVPKYVKTVEKWYYNAADFLGKYGVDMPKIALDTTQITGIGKNLITQYGDTVIETTVTITTSIVAAVVDLILGLVFSIYVLCQKENLGRQAKKTVHALFKPCAADRIIDVTKLANDVFTKFATGQFTEACIIGILCFIGMQIFNMPYAAIISVLVGFTALIPIFGAFIGTGIGAFLILLEDPIKAFWFIVFIIVLQQLEGNLIYPRVVGKSVGLPGIWVLAAVTIGGGLFGIFGMLFSVPICSILYVLLKEYVNKKTEENDSSKEITDEVIEEVGAEN